MKKILVLISLLLLLVGCGGPKSSTGSTEAPSGEKKELVIWHTFTEHHEAKLQEIVADFNESQDKVTVTALTQPFDQFNSKVYEAVASKTGPNIVMLDTASAADYVDAGLALDFSKYIDVENYKSRISEGAYAESTGFTKEGLYAITIHSTGPVYFYNKTMFDNLGLEAPKTWDDVAANSKKIYEETGIVGFAIDSVADLGQMLLMQNGVEYIDSETKTVDWNDPSTVEWLNKFKEGVQAGYFQLKPTTGDYNSGDISGHVLASYIGSSAGIDYLDLKDHELAVVPVPQVAGTNTKWIQQWTRNIIGFTSDDEVVNQGIADFAEFFTNTENSSAWTQVFGSISAYSDVKDLPEYKEYIENNIALGALVDQSSYAGALPTMAGAQAVRSELDKMMTQVATGQIDAEIAIENANVASNNALK
ncbi:MAG: extracellular solute-binding protein [Erysipelotrichaceae bacterium]|nr:extracellular solute-binding protein [Bacillota bacterium]